MVTHTAVGCPKQAAWLTQVVREDVLSALYGHHVDVLHLKDRILVVAGKDEGHHLDPAKDRASSARGRR